MIPRRLATSSARRLSSAVQDSRPLASSYASSSKLAGLRLMSDTVVPTTTQASDAEHVASALLSSDSISTSTAAPFNPGNKSAFLPPMNNQPYPRVAPRTLPLDRAVRPKRQPRVYGKSALDVNAWNERLQAAVRANQPFATVQGIAKEMRRLHVIMDETTVQLLLSRVALSPDALQLQSVDPNETSAEVTPSQEETLSPAALQLQSLGPQLYVLPESAKPLTFDQGLAEITKQQNNIRKVQAEFTNLQSQYKAISTNLAKLAKREPPTMPDYFAAPFPEMDALLAELKTHYDTWDAQVPQYDAAVLSFGADLQRALAHLADCERMSSTESERDGAIEAAQQAVKQAREAHELAKEHAKSAVAFRDNFKRERETLVTFAKVDNYDTPSLDDFKAAYHKRYAALPRDNRAVWRERLRKDEEELSRLANIERRLIDSSRAVDKYEEAIRAAREKTDLTRRVDYETLPPTGQREFDLIRESQAAGLEAAEAQRATFAARANAYAEESKQAEALIKRVADIEKLTFNSLTAKNWDLLARRFATSRLTPGASLPVDLTTAFVSTFQLYSAWVAKYGDEQRQTDISIVLLEALANVVQVAPAYPPAINVATEVLEQLLTSQRGASLRAVRKNAKHLSADIPANYEPLPPLATRNVPILRLLEALTAVVGKAAPKEAASPEDIDHMNLILASLKSALSGETKGVFTFEDYAEFSKPKKAEGLIVREAVERLAAAFENRIQYLRRKST